MEGEGQQSYYAQGQLASIRADWHASHLLY